MIKLSPDNTKRQLAIHGWVGLILGFLLYVIVVTGAVVVFIEELSQWSVSGHVEPYPLTQSVHRSIETLAQRTPEMYHQDIDVRSSYQGYLLVSFTADNDVTALEPTNRIQYLINPLNLDIIETNTDPKQFIDTTASSWIRFIREVHTDLYIPGRVSRYIVGLFGMILLIATISGFLLHRHLIRDLFLSPRKSNQLLYQRDGHNLAGTWSLPFAFILALTGAVICFDTRIGLPVMVMTVYEGDADKALNKLLPKPDVKRIAKASSTEIYNLDQIVADASQRIAITPTRLSIHGYGSLQTLVTTVHPAIDIDNNLFDHSLLFNGNNGQFIEEITQLIGERPTVSSRAHQLIYTLHYGNFSGWLSKLLWLILSVVLSYVIITGFNLWFERRIKDPLWQRLYLSVPILSYGVPISLMTSGIGYFLVQAGVLTTTEKVAIWIGFWLGWLISFLSLLVYALYQYRGRYNLLHQDSAAVLKDSNIQVALPLISYYLLYCVVILCVLLPVMRWWVSTEGWISLANTHNYMVIIIDVVFLSIAVFLVRKLIARHPLCSLKQQS